MLLHLICAFEVITLPNERVIALFHHIFLQFRHIVKSIKKAHNTTTSRPPVLCILQILVTFNLYSARPRVRLLVNSKKRSDKQWLRFQGGGGGGVATTPPLARYVSRMIMITLRMKVLIAKLTAIRRYFEKKINCMLLS